MNEYYGWSNDGMFYCDGYGFGLTQSLRTVRVGETENLIKEHPPAVKEAVLKLHRINRKGVKR